MINSPPAPASRSVGSGRIGFVAALGLWGLAANGATLDDTTPADALDGVAAVVEAEVVEIENSSVYVEGEWVPVRYHHLSVEAVYAGAIVGDGLRLVLPGGELDGKLVTFSGTPTLSVGDHFIAALQSNGSDIVRIDWWATGWFLRASADADAYAVTPWRDPIVSISCDGPVQIARPLSEARSISGDGPATSGLDVDTSADANPVFIDDPASVAAPWDSFVEDYLGCVAAVAPEGTTISGTESGGAR